VSRGVEVQAIVNVMKIKNAQQLKLEIDDARSGRDGTPQTNEQLIEYIIGIYGAEFEKANDEIRRLRQENDTIGDKNDAIDKLTGDLGNANDEIARLHKANDALFQLNTRANEEITRQKAANDELFKIKQKVVIANRALLHKLALADDLAWCYNNDPKFRAFVDHKCAEAIEIYKKYHEA
jgi:hypothetical protein